MEAIAEVDRDVAAEAAPEADLLFSGLYGVLELVADQIHDHQIFGALLGCGQKSEVAGGGNKIRVGYIGLTCEAPIFTAV